MKPIPLSTVIKRTILFSIIGILLLVTGLCVGSYVGIIVLIAGLIVLAATIVFFTLFYRCPHCGGSLTVPYRNYYCPHCGTYLT